MDEQMRVEDRFGVGAGSDLKLDLDSLHCLGEVAPRERRQFIAVMLHAAHRHPLGAVTKGCEIRWRNAAKPLCKKLA